MTTFIPKQQQFQAKTVYFEDSQAEKIPGYTTQKTEHSLKTEIISLLNRMGAQSVFFTEGTFAGKPARDGYEITFTLGVMQARLHCAALPVRKPTPNKKQQALRQALFLIRDWLQASILVNLNQPPADVLAAYLLDNQGRTAAEGLLRDAKVPMLPQPRFTE